MQDHVVFMIKNSKNKFLFCQRSKHKTKLPLTWAFPSGTKEPSETIFQTARREALEEVDLIVTPESIMCTKELPEFQDKLHFAICKLESGTAKIKEPKEIEALEWLSFTEFFKKYSDNQIGHGLIYLRKNPHLWEKYN